MLTEKDGAEVIAVKVAENHHLQSAFLYSEEYHGEIQLDGEAGADYTELDGGTVILYFDPAGESEKTLYIDLVDYAYNVSTGKLDASGFEKLDSAAFEEWAYGL